MMDDFLGWLGVAACFALALCPPRYDPAIRLRLWLDRKKRQK